MSAAAVQRRVFDWGPALAVFLGRLGVELPGRAAAPIENTRGETVGEIVAIGS